MLATKYGCAPGNRQSDQHWMGLEVSVTRGGNRRLDAVIMDIWGNYPTLYGFEVKVTASDLRKEFENNLKHSVFYDKLDYYSILCPREIVDKDIIPKNIGILVPATNNNGLSWIRRPLHLNDAIQRKVDLSFIASFIRRQALFEKDGLGSDGIAALKQQAYNDGYQAALKKERNEESWENKQIRKSAEIYDELCKAAGISVYSDDYISRVPFAMKLADDLGRVNNILAVAANWKNMISTIEEDLKNMLLVKDTEKK